MELIGELIKNKVVINNGIIRIKNDTWVEVKTRKNHKCVICELTYKKNQPMFRPLTNKNNRMDRICHYCGLS